MGLSCSCPDGDDFSYCYEEPQDFTTLLTLKRKRCCSCKSLIEKNAPALRFSRWRYPKDEIEERIHGDGGEIHISPFWMCEACGDQYMNLTALKYCVDPTENMMDLVKEYAEMHTAVKV